MRETDKIGAKNECIRPAKEAKVHDKDIPAKMGVTQTF
jgi:hypothetical protein